MLRRKEKLEDIIWLDLDKVELYGFEKFKHVKVIANMVREIEAEADFPPVYVAKLENKKYALSGYYDEVERTLRGDDNYGGHHRALAHWIAGKPLKCQLTKNYWKISKCNLNIKNIKLRSYK